MRLRRLGYLLVLSACSHDVETQNAGPSSRALGVETLSAVRREHGSQIELYDADGRSIGSIFAERTDEHRVLRLTYRGVVVEHADEGPGEPLELSTANA